MKSSLLPYIFIAKQVQIDLPEKRTEDDDRQNNEFFEIADGRTNHNIRVFFS